MVSSAWLMEEFDFFAQSRAVQDRFLESAGGRADPWVLAYAPPADRAPLGLTGGALALLVLALGLAAIGYGSLDSRFALAPVWMAGVEAGLLGVAAALLALAGARAQKRNALPFRIGMYLFPSGLVIARGRKLEVHPLDELTAATASGSRLSLAFGSHAYTLPMKDAKAASRTAEQVLAQRDVVLQARQAGDERALARLDPLKDTGVVSPLAPTTPLKAPAVSSRVLTIVGAAVVGAALGGGVWYFRNVRSEAALYRAAREQDSVSAYQRYLARGGKRAEVASLLLPRAQLAQARKAGTIEAIEKFIHDHPDSKVIGEARAALKDVLVKQINALSKAGKVGELRGLAHHRHADLVKTEVEQAIAGDYRREVARYTKGAGGASAAGRGCILGLLNYAEKHGPAVEVRTLELDGGSLTMADVAVKHSPYFPGSAAIPSHYFDEASLERRAKNAAQAVAGSLQKAFPSDVLSFHVAAPLDPEHADPKALKVPTLIIEHRTVLSSTFANASPPMVICGLALTFVARCTVPGRAPGQVLRQSTWNPPSKDVLKSGDPPAKIYDDLVAGKQSDFEAKLLATLGLPAH